MSSNPMELRPLGTPEDSDYALNIIDSVLTGMGLNLQGQGRSEIASLPASFRANGGEFWLMFVNGSAVGTVGVRPINEAHWEIKWLYLLPSWRSMGIGRMMAEKAIDFARSRGANRISISTHTVFAIGHALMKSLRFQVVEDIDLDSYQGAYTMRRVWAR